MRLSRWMWTIGTMGVGGLLLAAAPLPPFDFSGHWTGTAEETGKPQRSVSADLVTGAKPRTFTGALTDDDVPPAQCTVNGKEKRSLKVRIRLRCGDSVVKLRGTLVPDTATVSGTSVRIGRHKRHTGTFTLTKQTT